MYWAADRTTLLRVYRCITRFRMDYRFQIFGSASASVLKTLNPIHRRVLRLATGAFCTCPVVSLYAGTGESFLAHRLDKLCLQMYTCILGMSRTPEQCSLTSPDSDHYFRIILTTLPMVSEPVLYYVLLLKESVKQPKITLVCIILYK